MSFPESDHKHVDASEVAGANIAAIVDALVTAPSLPSLRPTRKWIAARVTALSTWATVVLASPILSWRELALGLLPLIAEGVISYLTPNVVEPGGVRVKTE